MSGCWHFRDIARSRMDVRFRGKNGHAADITGMTESDPLRKSVAKIAVMHNTASFNDVLGCDPRTKGST
jgi:hypothetical protein